MGHETIKKLFQEILDMERVFIRSYGKLVSMTDNDEWKKIFKEIALEEKKHEKNALEMLRILEE